jgi:hypothetical protein
MRMKLEDLMSETKSAYRIVVWNMQKKLWERQVYVWEYNRHIDKDREFFFHE